MSEEKVLDYEIFFLTYREPNADQNYDRLVRQLTNPRLIGAPRLTRVDGVKGIDVAHKHCASIAQSPYMLTIDGDCQIDSSFFRDITPYVEPSEENVLVFPSENSINGLQYGNGSLKIWPVKMVLDAGPMGLDYCCTLPRRKGHLINRCYAVTHINATPKQAWAAGFRESVKLSTMFCRPSTNLANVPADNLKRLRVWCSVGADVENGRWAMLGARQGIIYALKSSQSEPRELVNDYDWLDQRFLDLGTTDDNRISAPLAETERILLERLNFEVVTFNRRDSRIFKLCYFNPKYITADERWVSFREKRAAMVGV